MDAALIYNAPIPTETRDRRSLLHAPALAILAISFAPAGV